MREEMRRFYMTLPEIAQAIFQYGGTLIMAALFVWVFIEDKKKTQVTLESNTEILKTLALSNDNIAKSLEIISDNCKSVDKKIDRNNDGINRNYEAIMKGGNKNA